MFTDDDLRAILAGHSWIEVKPLAIPEGTPKEQAFRMLEAHHLRETTFLIGAARALATELLDLRGRMA
jgi:hypothetical protein